ncbi:MAG: TlpA family protein disulfide reductase, partial [Clostridia bacterium]|nr:TlpA family protein disulfide reductase [Clostridia bacterium]
MKNSVKWAIIAVLLVAIIGGSTVLYNTLSKDYKVNNIVVYSSDKETAENDASDENVSSTEAVTSTETATSSDKTSNAEKTGSTGKTSSTPKNSSTNKTSSTPKSSSQVKPSSEVTTTTSTPEEEAFVGDFTVEDMNGNKVKLSDFLGKPIVLNFWTSWCGYCKQEMPDFDRAAKENPNVAFVMVNITRDSRETIGKAKAYV